MAEKQYGQDGDKNQITIPRRYFLRISGTATFTIGLTGWISPDKGIPMLIKLADGKTAVAVSQGYLLVDIKKCQGCVSCMLACSALYPQIERSIISHL